MSKKIGRPREYSDKAHREQGDYMVGWYWQNREKILAALRADRLANPEKYRERDRQRYEKHKKKRCALAKKWKKNNPEKVAKSNRLWIERNPLARKAQIYLSNAIRDGRIIRGRCEVCNKKKDVQAHHEDYSKPLEVRWLCAIHHNEWHKEQREQERNSK